MADHCIINCVINDMIAVSLEKALDFAKTHDIPRVLEMRCARCDQTMYAVTDDDKHEHRAWLDTLKNNSAQRYVSCKRCGYGRAPGESSFIFKTHEVRSR
jgi:DNA-directed RNA polymerase subunit RPC12/RpoP